LSGRAQQLRLLEALLFAVAEPIGEEALARHIDEAADIAGLLRELAESYAGRGVNLVRLAGGWTFRTAPDLAASLRIERPVARKLSRAAIETLAVIAYHQPVTRAEIEQIRGVALGKGTIDTWMEAGWVRPKGRRAGPGRPLLWVTTPGFLIHFGLDSLNELLGPHIFPPKADGSSARACPSCNDGQLSLNVGKFGAFIGCSSYPECRYTRPLTLENGNGENGNGGREPEREKHADPGLSSVQGTSANEHSRK